jgi:hypothetical protein
MWDEILSCGIKYYHLGSNIIMLDQCCHVGVECYHVGSMLSYGGRMLSCGNNFLLVGVKCEIQCYHVLLSCDVIM